MTYRHNIFPNADFNPGGVQPDSVIDGTVAMADCGMVLSSGKIDYGGYCHFRIPATVGERYHLMVDITEYVPSAGVPRGPIVEVRDAATQTPIVKYENTSDVPRTVELTFTAWGGDILVIFRGPKTDGTVEMKDAHITVSKCSVELAETYETAVAAGGVKFFSGSTRPRG